MTCLQRISAISQCTFRESIRSKILYSVLVFAILILAASSLFGSVSIGDQVTVVKDFGLFAISFFSVLYCVITGSLLLHKELTKKTILTILAKPVPRWEFLTGKFFGLASVAFILLILMAVGLTAFLFLLGAPIEGELLTAYYHIALEACIVSAIVIFFSSIVVTPLLIGLFSFGIVLAGRSLSSLMEFSAAQELSSLGKLFFDAIFWCLPHLEAILVSDIALANGEVPVQLTIWATLYTVSYALTLLLLAQALFRKREFH